MVLISKLLLDLSENLGSGLKHSIKLLLTGVQLERKKIAVTAGCFAGC